MTYIIRAPDGWETTRSNPQNHRWVVLCKETRSSAELFALMEPSREAYDDLIWEAADPRSLEHVRARRMLQGAQSYEDWIEKNRAHQQARIPVMTKAGVFERWHVFSSHHLLVDAERSAFGLERDGRHHSVWVVPFKRK
jgi:uncharacterized short protein YbdD (DUF466 family)